MVKRALIYIFSKGVLFITRCIVILNIEIP